MADKKYIGKPGKQDDPCWKGYEMVGMKTKNGKKVPNCVPEAVDIIEKARKIAITKARGKKDWTGAKAPKDQFLMPEENDLEENWIVKKGTEVVSAHKTKDEADVKAMKHPLYKVYAKEEAELEEAGHQEYYVNMHGKSKPDGAAYNHKTVKVMASSTEEAKKKAKEQFPHNKADFHGFDSVGATSKLAKEEAELEEGGLWDNIHAKRKRIKAGSGERMRKPGSKGAPTAAALKASQNEQAEQIDELSKGTLGKYINKAKDHIDTTSWRQGHREGSQMNPSGRFEKKLTKRHKGIETAVSKLTKEEVELEEAYGMWKVDFPKQHAGKAVAAGSVHVKAQNTAHAHKVAAKRVGVDHKVFKSKVTKSSILPEESELDEAKNSKQYIEVEHKLGGIKRVPVHSTKAYAALNHYRGLPHTKSARIVSEELGKDNEWGRPELRKKFAAMTPGQEGMTADKIPSFDPRYDDVTTQYCGGLGEEVLNEISAKGAALRAKFQAKIQKTLADPESIRKAKKKLAKQKAAATAAEPKHLVMQLRKATSIGSKVEFRDGSSHHVAPNHVEKFNDKYHSLKSSIEKESLVNRAHKSHADFMKAIAEETIHENCGTPDCCGECQPTGPQYQSHRGHGGYIGTVEASDEDIRFGDVDDEELYADLEKDVDNLSWEDIVDTYDPEELDYEDDAEESEDIAEAITPQGRLKKRFNAIRTKSRRNMARNLALKRVSTPDKLKARSVRTARRMVYKRLLRNRDMATVSAAEKTRIEAQVKRMAPMVARLSIRVMPQVRKLEQSRIKKSRGKKK